MRCSCSSRLLRVHEIRIVWGNIRNRMGSEGESVLPIGTRPLDHQVAGHRHGAGKTKLGMLQGEKDTNLIYKAVQNPPRGRREMEFYQQVFSPDCTDPDLLKLKNLLPQFSGIYYYKEMPEVPYLKLENIVSKFRKPCVADLKMGSRTYDPTASAEKIESEEKKYPPAAQIGFQFTGLQVYNPAEGKMEYLDKFWCRELKEEDLLVKGLGKFFGIDHHLRKDVISVLLDKLEHIKKWFDSQKKFAFYASSLLLVYEGDLPVDGLISETKSIDRLKGPKLTETNSHDLDTGKNSSPLVDVKMIDFTHVFLSDKHDENYLFGLRNLIKYLNQLLELG